MWVDTRMDHVDEVNKVRVQQFSDSLSILIIQEYFPNRRYFELFNYWLHTITWNSKYDYEVLY